ncbi:N5-glutamine S-adenosyl-L-methionine-dependent methyltransferase [Gigaspora margarita]|uniref:N5-glutamine S-adenosyl-L-methionine-dependent methyltransferase n=1 Tax=Gigaspora margarita TaxID=4874 RepID=A0A8H3WWH9_GIGMA|nr:N5-glutamine S-adenosyl-L-methionine-dependent methyltransferase [Gigaspora margarita]
MTSIGHGSTQTQSQSALTYLEYTATLLPNVLIVYIGGHNGSSSNVSLTNMTQVCTSEYQFLAPAVKEQPKEALIAANEVEIGPHQAEKVIKLIIEHLAKVKVSIFPDYSGRPRIQVFNAKLFIWSTKVMYTINIISGNNSS